MCLSNKLWVKLARRSVFALQIETKFPVQLKMFLDFLLEPWMLLHFEFFNATIMVLFGKVKQQKKFNKKEFEFFLQQRLTHSFI